MQGKAILQARKRQIGKEKKQTKNSNKRHQIAHLPWEAKKFHKMWMEQRKELSKNKNVFMRI